MKKLIILLLIILCSCTYCPKYKTLQVTYTENGEQKYLFLNVKEETPYHFYTISEEYLDSTDIVITEIFDYNE